MSVKYCRLCDRNVATIKKFSWAWFLIWFIFGAGFGGLVYLLYYVCKRRKFCPICNVSL